MIFLEDPRVTFLDTYALIIGSPKIKSRKNMKSDKVRRKSQKNGKQEKNTDSNFFHLTVVVPLEQYKIRNRSTKKW